MLYLALISVAQPAAAQTTTLLSATMVPGQGVDASGFCGDNGSSQCWGINSESNFGTMTDDDFRIGSTTYTVRYLYHSPDGNEDLYLNIFPDVSSADQALMSLRIGNLTLAFSDADDFSAVRPGLLVSWNVTPRPWTVGNSISIQLRGPGTAPRNTSSSSSSSSTAEPVPTPRPVVRTCDAFTSGIVVGGAPLGAQCQHLDDAGVGNADVVAAGYIAAVDVWGYIGAGVEVCFEGSGEIILLDAATSPRSLVELTAYPARGLTCAFIDRPGTVVLMSPQSASGIAASNQQTSEQTAETTLQDCMVTTQYALNFRDGPAGAIMSVIASGWTLTATARTPDWFQVDVYGAVGWISAHHVTTAGNCA